MKYAEKEQYTIYRASCLDVMDSMEENSVDAIVTDPPYEIGFMNKGWDNTGIAFDVNTWKKALRVLKPGGYLLAFNHSRTFHRMMVAIEDAGFELRDTMMWLYGSGFPKSHNISKAIDKSLGVERGKIAEKVRNPKTSGNGTDGTKGATRPFIEKAIKENSGIHYIDDNNPISPQAKQWDGYGTALKPAFEPIVMARKPFNTSVAENVLTYGVGGINIDECRIEFVNDKDKGDPLRFQTNNGNGNHGIFNASKDVTSVVGEKGRFPANIMHDGSKEATKDMWDWETDNDASRYFYCAKASVKDRDEGLGGFEHTTVDDGRDKSIDNAYQRGETLRKNIHPTVKPTELMQYLIRLVAPKGSKVMDIFMGSGSTGKACMIENTERDANYHFIGIDLDSDENGNPLGYCDIAQARIEWGINFRQLENQSTMIDDDGKEITVIQERLF